MSEINIIEADLSDPEHADAILSITNTYAAGPMGMEEEFEDEVKEHLIREMSLFPLTICFLAFEEGKAVGVANCFYGFSTFNARKLINIHDLAVMPEMRGKGIGQKLLEAVEQKAIETDCCKVTLEVREDNRAKNLYKRMGFSYGDPVMYFMTKELDDQ